MDNALLTTLISESQTRHFGNAAESLYQHQPSVRFRIRQTQSQFWLVLFNRHRPNIQLSPAGER
ncbi:LysR family transcriptional regulator [Plesiomonas shigelloides]|uniref:LysR family transcriptional regulator n=1 Tax=Plesiomonas shigelloides TaxID=703 RepID=A0A8I1W9K0_PLESH|nr:LysR family transcriptional regulator [Plesiomonas shigelloides]